MDKHFLESSEFYSARYNNFSTIIIIPTVILLFCLLLFSLFGKRENVITGNGEIAAVGTVPDVQTTVNSEIKHDYLAEGKYVHKGQRLLTYSNVGNRSELGQAKAQGKQLKNQVVALKRLKDSISNNRDTFTKDDKFGYRAILRSYLNQRRVYLTENRMLTKKSLSDKSKQSELINTESNVVDRGESSLQSYQHIYAAVKSGNKYGNDRKYSYLYQEYQAKLKNIKLKQEKNSLKVSFLEDLQSQIDTQKDSLASAKIQLTELKDFDRTKYDVSSNKTKLLTLQDDQLTTVATNLVKVEQNLGTVKTDLKKLQSDSHLYVVKASKSGILHVDSQYVGEKYVGTGSTIAQIYPVLKNQKEVKIAAYIPSTDISSVRLEQDIRFKVARNVTKPIVLTGKINKIGISPTNFNKGNYYLVTAKAKIDSTDRYLLKYGMMGSVSIITGKTTIWGYYKNVLFNKNK